MADVDKTKLAVSAPTSSILGTYEGECADATITNKNGLDITREVWETVFASDDYRQAIELGWYIGFLGHPEDPNCMDFRNACIVMTDGNIDADGKVYGKFNLIDTPVGKVVKAFQDAGVTFGISVRGAGDIIDNSVDPDSFVFRGFDLVTFPAFPDSIPTFTSIAASTDVETRTKYQRVCAAVNSNINELSDVNTIEVIQAQFAKQSDEYKALEARKQALIADGETSEETDIDAELESITAQKVDSVMRLYLESEQANSELIAECEQLRRQLTAIEINAAKKLKAVKRITADQLSSINKGAQRIEAANKTLVAANQKLKSEIEDISNQNLKYSQKIRISASTIQEKDKIISRLQSKLDETVSAASIAQGRTSDLDAKLKESNAEVVAARKMLAQYQRAYSQMYANAIGADLTDVNITASTSVTELQKIIRGASLHSGKSAIFASRDNAYEEVDIVDSYNDNDLVTM